jgi:hypothetical protein
MMDEFIYGEVQSAIKSKVSSAQFFAITCDETTSVDNGSWLSVHAYVCEDWTRVPHLIELSRIQEAPTASHLIAVIVEALEKGGVLDQRIWERSSSTSVQMGSQCSRGHARV